MYVRVRACVCVRVCVRVVRALAHVSIHAVEGSVSTPNCRLYPWGLGRAHHTGTAPICILE